MSQSPQSKGGAARAARLTSEERSAIAARAAQARWERIDSVGGLAVADTAGILTIGDIGLEVYVLKDRRRVINKRAMAKALHLQSEGGNAFMRTMSRKGIRSVISADLATKIETPLSFTTPRGDLADGYEAEVLIDVCDAIIQARNERKLASSQSFLAIQAEIIVRSAAKVGITALVDEATGYQDKTKDEYRKLFDQFIKKEFSQWEKEFPDKFFDMIYRLYGLRRQRPDQTTHPQFFAHFIRRYVYFPLANSHGAILEQLEQQNPVVYTGGGRKYKFHQWLTKNIGVPAFRQHLWQVIGIGESSSDKKNFERGFYRAFPEAIPKKDSEQGDFFDALLAKS